MSINFVFDDITQSTS